jgi:acetoin utilization protein AcuC
LTTGKAVFVHSERLDELTYPPQSPFNTSRAGRLRKIIYSMGMLSGPDTVQVVPQLAQRKDLERIHSARYLDALEKASRDGNGGVELLFMGIGTGDCPIFPDMYDYSVLACGATLTAARMILDGSARVAFNPSGGYHHAWPEQAAGFCYINDVAIACHVLAEAGKRVFYLDIDVHNGDGVAGAFYERRDVMTLSFHESGKTLFPGTGFEDEIGQGDGTGYCVNVPLPAGIYDQAYLKAFDDITIPLIKAFKPDVIVLEFGADALAGDPLAHLRLTNNTYADIIQTLLTFGKPILMTGGGGYHVENTVRAWALGWGVLSGSDSHHDNIGMGGVMLESTDWSGGLRDRHLPETPAQRQEVLPAIENTVKVVKANIFPIHGL